MAVTCPKCQHENPEDTLRGRPFGLKCQLEMSDDPVDCLWLLDKKDDRHPWGHRREHNLQIYHLSLQKRCDGQILLGGMSHANKSFSKNRKKGKRG